MTLVSRRPAASVQRVGRDGAQRLNQSGGARGDDERWKAMVSHTSWSFQPEHNNKMQWCYVFAAVVAVVSGQRVSYDGTPLADGVVVIKGGNSGTPAQASGQTFFGISPRAVTVPQGASRDVPHAVFPGFVPAAPQHGFPVISPPQPIVSPAIQDPLPCSYGAGTLVHETSLGRREYHFSWCPRPGQTFSHAQADHYCRSLPYDGHPVGFHAVSIEDHAEDALISTIISAYRVPFIWTSGKKVSAYAWKWQNGVTSLYTNWSHTGRVGRAQPDNYAGDEYCLAVLNNIYGDGITWHDSSCHNNKYVICERPKAYGSQ